MTEEKSPPPEKKRKRKRYQSSTNIHELRETSRLTKTAIEKISNGTPITEDEFFAIFKSDSIPQQEQDALLENIANKDDLQLNIPKLFIEQPKIVHGYLDFWVPDLESEMLTYFRDHPSELYSMAPRKFEELVAAIFRNNGFSVQLTPETRDGGVDLIAVHHSSLTGETVNLVECKRYGPTQKVGIGIVQRLLGCVHEHKASKGILVTTSFFTRDAQHVAMNSRHNLALNDYNSVTSWLAQLPFTSKK
ncbi:restriction endonuclease [Hydrogenophaga pseudoflava]|uniref:restriction endonuclease n=1 Tax=Hydrogenophaga pseudoflava TaxID=47421 RepID=UPI0027E3F442|nr:restriction endonuclease [Hydrogenophaga pseudoflava]MDQ7743886.1 restriction endonuclease [Hydrogenophaga pseudoflava]